MMNSNSELTEIIIRHLQGSATEAEEQQLKNWLGQSAENASFYSDYRTVWEKTKLKESDFTPDVDAAWKKVRSRTNPDASTDAAEISVQTESAHFSWWKIAAVLFLLTGLGFLAFRLYLSSPEFIEVTASRKMDVKLPDGSVVSMDTGSKIRYREEFDSVREVFLTGQAFFEVVRDTTRPFRVEGKLSTTEVLGTSFNVRAVPGENFEETTVVTGRVSVKEKQSEQLVIITPGMTATVSRAGKIVSEDVKETNAVAWKTGELIFEDQNLKQVADDLTDYFGKEVTVSSDLDTHRFTGRFRNPSIDQVLNVIAISTEAKILKKDQGYIISR
jgi:transmembrane sensor